MTHVSFFIVIFCTFHIFVVLVTEKNKLFILILCFSHARPKLIVVNECKINCNIAWAEAVFTNYQHHVCMKHNLYALMACTVHKIFSTVLNSIIDYIHKISFSSLIHIVHYFVEIKHKSRLCHAKQVLIVKVNKN